MPKKTPANFDPLFTAYRAAKATHDAAVHALNAALKSDEPLDPELVRGQIENGDKGDRRTGRAPRHPSDELVPRAARKLNVSSCGRSAGADAADVIERPVGQRQALVADLQAAIGKLQHRDQLAPAGRT